MTILTVRHRTRYRYRRSVAFGPHRLMFRPRDSHDIALVGTGLIIQPACDVRWLHDVFGNSIAVASFAATADTLFFESVIRVRHFGFSDLRFPIEPFAENFPFSYGIEEMPDLVRTIERHYADPKRKVDAWARSFLETGGKADTQAMLAAMTRTIKADFAYQARDEEGTQEPTLTLDRRSGSCRDFALLMMEGCRSLGLAARFVTGYLYDPVVDGGPEGTLGAGATHAWVQVYLPGAGWVEFDPTNGLVGNRNLIRVAVARDPSQAIPLSGTYHGDPDDCIGMQVTVEVTTGALPDCPMPETDQFGPGPRGAGQSGTGYLGSSPVGAGRAARDTVSTQQRNGQGAILPALSETVAIA